MIRAYEAKLKTQYHKEIDVFKRFIEEEICNTIELGYYAQQFDLRGKSETVIDFVTKWLSELGYKCVRNSGNAGHDGDYDVLRVSWE